MEVSGLIELGGNIQLVGFKELDPASMIVVKKIVGNYAKRFSEVEKDFEKLVVTMKKSGAYQVNCRLLTAGRVLPSEVEDHNLFFAIDKGLAKLMNEIKE